MAWCSIKEGRPIFLRTLCCLLLGAGSGFRFVAYYAGFTPGLVHHCTRGAPEFFGAGSRVCPLDGGWMCILDSDSLPVGAPCYVGCRGLCCRGGGSGFRVARLQECNAVFVELTRLGGMVSLWRVRLASRLSFGMPCRIVPATVRRTWTLLGVPEQEWVAPLEECGRLVCERRGWRIHSRRRGIWTLWVMDPNDLV